MKKEKIIFIINPVSGSKSKAALPFLINKNIDGEKYEHQIIFTDYSGQATEISSLAMANGINMVVAVGGDGTVNEIGKVLINSSVKLGIIPGGSGNGLARHLKIPLDTLKAIQTINSGNQIVIDAGKVNDRYFFCTSGVGFDAHIGEIFAKKTHRGLQGYLTSTIKEFFSYTPEKYKISVNGSTFERKAFLVTFANASQYGNNAFIAPHADIQDHLLDVCVMRKFPAYASAGLGFRIFAGSIQKSTYVEFFKADEITLERPSSGVIHLDGEPVQMGNKLVVKMFPSALRIITPSSGPVGP